MLEKLENVTATLKANVYFDGKVVSHTFELKNGSKKTAGLIYPGQYKFGTKAAERMDILEGSCKVRLLGQNDWKVYEAGTFFEVPANSSFEIAVVSDIAQYLCSYKKG